MAAVKKTLSIDCVGKPTREINAFIRQAADDGVPVVELLNPQARHNLGVCVLKPIHIVIRGHVGYYAAGLSDHITVEIHGSAGWGVGDNLMHGEVVVHGNAATSAAPSIRGGTVVVKGDAGPRSGISLKSGLLVVGGNSGYMTGFMMQKGRIVICGNTAKALGDSMYQGSIFIGGSIEELGSGCEIVAPEADELDDILKTLDHYQIKAPKAFRKIRSDKSLWNFNKHDFAAWKDVL